MVFTIKILLLPVVVALLIYFRAVIFQPHVSQYADDAQLYLEQRYDISIPVYTVENTAQESAEVSVAESADNAVDESSIDVSLDKKPADLNLADSSNSVQELSSENAGSAVDSPRIVEQEILIILNSDNNNKHRVEDPVDTIKQESTDSTKLKTDVVESAAKPIKDTSTEVAIETEQQNKQKVIDPAIMAKLSDTVDIINRKVDMLFDINEHNNEAQIAAVESEDFAVIKKRSIKSVPLSESEISPSVTNHEQAPVNARDMLMVARQTFWNGNPLDSEKLYLDLVSLQENNPNVYGELGNVYYSQGKWQQAGKAYYEAAIRLLDLKQTQQVNYLLRVIQGLDAESAEKLKLKISG